MARRITLLVAAACLLAWAIPAGGAAAQDDGVWQTIEPGGDTVCAHGTPYRFFAREGSSDHLLIFFQGGGACWDGNTCGGGMTFDPATDEDQDSPAIRATGIFDLAHPDNPFRDYDMVYVTYCTGDVHLGSAQTTYTGHAGEVTIHHNGYANAQAALAWAYEAFPTPESIAVMGCSAGGLGSIFHAPSIIEHYEGVPVVQLSDASGGYRGQAGGQVGTWGTLDVLPENIPALADLAAGDLTFDLLYASVAAAYPEVQFAQCNSARDSVQSLFMSMTGTPFTYGEGLAANLDDISAANPGFRSYTAWGAGHCLTDVPAFYTMQVDGVRFRDWVAALVSGEDVASVACTDCTTPETYEP